MGELKELKEKLIQITSYPTSLKAVACEIDGIGFFPGARGLYEANDTRLTDKSIMILGHDFGTEKDYLKSVRNGKENLQGLTWKNLIGMLSQFQINPKECFFTNAIMGVRTDVGALGKSPGFEEPTFLNDCKRFLIEQINILRPNLILSLGKYIWKFLAGVSSDLAGLNRIRTFRQLDDSIFNRLGKVRFNGINDYSTSLAFITHPTYWHLNVKNRKYKEFIGIEAEKAIIKRLRSESTHKILD